MLEIRFLGQFDVRIDGQPITIVSRPAQSLFAFLVLNAGTAYRREKLAGILWPESTERDARSNLRHALWRLNKPFKSPHPGEGISYLHVDPISIAFSAESDYWLDVAILKKPQGEGVSADGLIESLSAGHGELLPGFYDDWIALERERLLAVFEQKMANLLGALIKEQRWTDILDWGEQWIASGETPELAYRALMIAHSALGDLSKVAAVWQRCLYSMRKQLGVEPSAKTLGLYEQLAKGENPFLLAPPSAGRSAKPKSFVERRSPGRDRRKSPLA